MRAVLLWVANPLLIIELVIGGHLDAFVALFAIAAIVVSRRCTTVWHDVLVGLLVGVGARHQDQRRLRRARHRDPADARPRLGAAGQDRRRRRGDHLGLYYFSYGFVALKPVANASTMVISPTVWRCRGRAAIFGNHAERR